VPLCSTHLRIVLREMTGFRGFLMQLRRTVQLGAYATTEYVPLGRLTLPKWARRSIQMTQESNGRVLFPLQATRQYAARTRADYTSLSKRKRSHCMDPYLPRFSVAVGLRLMYGTRGGRLEAWIRFIDRAGLER